MLEQRETDDPPISYLSKLDSHLSDPFNARVYESLDGIYDPLDFFELLQRLLNLASTGEPLSAVQEVNNLNVSNSIKLFVMYFTCEKVRCRLEVFSLGKDVAAEEAMRASLPLMEKEYERLKASTAGVGFSELSLILSEDANERARGVVALDEVLSPWVRGIGERSFREGVEQAVHDEIIESKARQSEREQLETLVVELREKLPNFTTNRQVLALQLMLENLRAKANKSERARFIEFLTSKNWKEIYSRLNSTLVFANDGQDAAYVKAFFHELGLTEIEESLGADLNRAHEDLPSSRK